MIHHRHRSARAGFTLLEVMVAIVVFLAVGYGLTQAVGLADRSHGLVTRGSTLNASMRDTTGRLRSELQLASASRMTVETLPSGSHQLTMLQPIEVGGAPAWGVYDRRLGQDEESRTQPDWQVRYTVRTDAAGELELVRQVLDAAGVVQLQKRLLSDVRDGSNGEPGFQLVDAGDVWQVTLRTQGEGERDAATQTFDVRLRN